MLEPARQDLSSPAHRDVLLISYWLMVLPVFPHRSQSLASGPWIWILSVWNSSSSFFRPWMLHLLPGTHVGATIHRVPIGGGCQIPDLDRELLQCVSAAFTSIFMAGVKRKVTCLELYRLSLKAQSRAARTKLEPGTPTLLARIKESS